MSVTMPSPFTAGACCHIIASLWTDASWLAVKQTAREGQTDGRTDWQRQRARDWTTGVQLSLMTRCNDSNYHPRKNWGQKGKAKRVGLRPKLSPDTCRWRMMDIETWLASNWNQILKNQMSKWNWDLKLVTQDLRMAPESQKRHSGAE